MSLSTFLPRLPLISSPLEEYRDRFAALTPTLPFLLRRVHPGG